MSPSKRVLIVLTSHSKMGDLDKRTGFWLSELTHPYYALTKHNIDVDLASTLGGPAPVDPGSLIEQDSDALEFLSDQELMAKVYTTKALNEVNPDLYDAVLFAGGHGTMWDFPNSEALCQFAMGMYESGKFIAALCHGPAALVNLKSSDGTYIIDGKKVTGFTNAEEIEVNLQNIVPFSLEDKLRSRGSLFIGADKWSDHVISDGLLITGQNPQSATSLGEKLAELLNN